MTSAASTLRLISGIALALLMLLACPAEGHVWRVKDLPDDVEGKRIHVFGLLDPDPYTDRADEVEHERALELLRREGAILVDELNERIDFLVIGDCPLPYPTKPEVEEIGDPVPLREYIEAKKAYDDWHEKRQKLESQANVRGEARPSVRKAQRWLIHRTYPAKWKARNNLAREMRVGFDNVTLAAAIQHMRQKGDLDVLVDWATLREAGIQPDHPIDLEDMQVEAATALDQILDRSEEPWLNWQLDRWGVVLVSTEEGLGRLTAVAPAITTDHPDWNAAQQKAIKALRRPVNVNFQGVSLGRALAFLRHSTQTDLRVNWEEFAKLNLDRDTSVTMDLSEVPGLRALELMLRQMGVDGPPFTLDHEGVIHVPGWPAGMSGLVPDLRQASAGHYLTSTHPVHFSLSWPPSFSPRLNHPATRMRRR
ncbi:MAG: hypothetical protein R3336_04895 [Phycisphaeraceae bacterium]|nr:hypothetical protein [Phycisphaeraceae bacterium]